VIVPDVNVLVYAHREDAPDHQAYRGWLETVLLGDEPLGLSDLVLSGFLRVVTHPRVFKKPSPLDAALEFATQLRDSPTCVAVQPGLRHWEIFTRLCRQARVRGNLVADAFLAAMAIESGGEWITTDRDYSRFPGLRSRHPLE
jgi:toxin-antitoxin system PIN domain toxin